jgi:hypothetical protein
MGLYTMVFYGSLAAGSLLWGQVATFTSVATALLIAAALAVLGLVPAARLPLTR